MWAALFSLSQAHCAIKLLVLGYNYAQIIERDLLLD